jgi:hypothetical protein
MTIRKTTTILFSTLPFASCFATAQTSFESQLRETADALRAENSGAVGREEKLEAEHNLQIDRARQGQTAQARQYLNIARGTAGLDPACVR